MYPASLLMSAVIGSSPHDPPLYILYVISWYWSTVYGNVALIMATEKMTPAGFLLPSKFQNHVKKGLYMKNSDLIVMLNKRSGAHWDTKETFRELTELRKGLTQTYVLWCTVMVNSTEQKKGSVSCAGVMYVTDLEAYYCPSFRNALQN